MRVFAILAVAITLVCAGCASAPIFPQETDNEKDAAQWCGKAFDAPHQPHQNQSAGPDVALTMSGGGYRAMLYHVGALRRLNDAGILANIRVVSSVSGGSITAGVLALAWKDLRFEQRVVGGVKVRVATNFDERVQNPLIRFAGTDIDVAAALGSLLPGKSAAESVALHYDRELFADKTFAQVFPEETDSTWPMPYFIFNATNLQTGELWQFRPLATGGLVTGWTDSANIKLSQAVAASSAFPPFLSPMRLSIAPVNDKTPVRWRDCTDNVLAKEDTAYSLNNKFHTGRSQEPGADGEGRINNMRSHILLTDGGVRDNLGLTAVALINHRRKEIGELELDIFSSDGGRSYEMSNEPYSNWLAQVYRILGIATNEPDLLRIETLVQHGITYEETSDSERTELCGVVWAVGAEERRKMAPWKRDVCLKGDATYWSIERLPPNHKCDGKIPHGNKVPHGYEYPPGGDPRKLDDDGRLRLAREMREAVRKAGRISTRLHAMELERRQHLVNWGFLSTHYGLHYIQWMWDGPELKGDDPGRLMQCALTGGDCKLPFDIGFTRDKEIDKKLFPLIIPCPARAASD